VLEVAIATLSEEGITRFTTRRVAERAGASVREAFTARIQRCVDAGLLSGDVTDMAHVMLALAQGLAAQELARWLGPSAPAIERRWRLGVRSVLAGLSLT
jgi:hypothetical protein